MLSHPIILPVKLAGSLRVEGTLENLPQVRECRRCKAALRDVSTAHPSNR